MAPNTLNPVWGDRCGMRFVVSDLKVSNTCACAGRPADRRRPDSVPVVARCWVVVTSMRVRVVARYCVDACACCCLLWSLLHECVCMCVLCVSEKTQPVLPALHIRKEILYVNIWSGAADSAQVLCTVFRCCALWCMLYAVSCVL